MLTEALAGRLAQIALGHVEREYPNRLDHVLNGPRDLAGPRELHPIFFGSFDWHSCVHAYWMLARVLRLYPGLPEADRIRGLFTASLTEEKVGVELSYLARPLSGTFERPYGWAWLLKLAVELARHTDVEGRTWSAMLQPLARTFASRFRDYLPRANYPIRSGAHSNTAFAIGFALDYAETHSDDELVASVKQTARRWYLGDVDCQAWEPSGEDFLSACLTEAACMQRVLPPDEFVDWLGRFLPRLGRREPRTLFTPALVADRTDGRLAHLDGLNLSRAWCWNRLAAALPESDPRKAFMQRAAVNHRAASLPHLADHYMGEHWLATFAVLALEEVDSAQDSLVG